MTGGNCGAFTPFDKVAVATQAEFQYFANDDGALDATECMQLCSCLLLGYRRPKDGGLAPDADAGEAGICGSESPDPFQTARYTLCQYRGMTDDGHTVHCVGEQSSSICRGRDGACHASLGRGFGPSAVASWLAFAAATEAASIRSFVTLRRELRALRAPADLVSRAHRAAREEARHTRWMLRLARDRGGRVEWPRSVRLPPRDLEAVATENAVEGCVHETWAALLNHYQAVHATDVQVRAVMALIAADETAHAELAHDIDRWATRALPKAARLRVQRAKHAAARALTARIREHAAPLPAVLGLPGPSAEQFLSGELQKRLWS